MSGAEEALAASRAALSGERAWLVGGAIRDRILDRSTDDLDVVVDGDVEAVARRLARGAPGAAFPLSDAFGGWRVVPRGHAWQVDLTPLRGTGIEEDLALRDFTVNAMAEPLGEGGRVDPFGGADDLKAGRLRMVAERAFADDPLRVLRVARMACELGLVAEPETVAAAARRAAALGGVAAERVFLELKRVMASPDPVAGLDLMARLGATQVVLPELEGLRGIEQSAYHHLDVHDHTLAVVAAVVELERDPEPALGEHAPAVVEHLAQPLADEMDRGQALRFGALLHDVAKPHTRAVTVDGRVTFLGHDARGAEVARAALGRLRASERLRAHVAALARHHLRLGFLVHEQPLSRRAVFRYLKACEPVEVDVTVLSIADRLATRGRKADEAIARHLDLAHELLGEALRRRAAGSEPPLVRGDELSRELGVPAGPALGKVLAELEEARFAGEVSTRADAIARAKRLLAKLPAQ